MLLCKCSPRGMCPELMARAGSYLYLPGLQQRVTSPLAFTTLQLCLNIIIYLCRSAAHITSSSQKWRSLVIMMKEESHALAMFD